MILFVLLSSKPFVSLHHLHWHIYFIIMQISGIKITSPAPPKKAPNKSNLQPKKTTTTTQVKKPLNAKNAPKQNDPKTVKPSNAKVEEKKVEPKVEEKAQVEVQEESKTEVKSPQEDALKEQ